MIRPLYIKLRNFGSFGNKTTHIDFPGPGEAMLIMGVVGAGKSSIFNALSYNVTGKKTGSNTLINSINQRDMYTEVGWHVPGLDKPLIIKRGMKPSLLSIEGVPNVIGTIQKELDPIIAKYIPITDPQVLLNLCLLSATKSLPFFDLKKQERLSFLRNFVDTEKLDFLSEKAKTINLKLDRSSSSLEGEIKTITEQLAEINTKIDNWVVVDINSITVLPDTERKKLEEGRNVAQKVVTDNEQYVDLIRKNEVLPTNSNIEDASVLDCFKTKQELTVVMADIKQIEADIQKIKSVRDAINGQISSVNNAIRSAVADMDGIPAESCKVYFQELIDGYRSNLTQLEKDHKLIIANLEPIEALLVTKQKNKDELGRKILGIIESLTDRVKTSNENIRQVNTLLQNDDIQLNKRSKIQSDLDAKDQMITLRDETQTKLNTKRLELAKVNRLFLVSKEYRSILDNTWSYMANRMVPYLNTRLPFYMRELELDFAMQLDPKDISKPVFMGRSGVGELTMDDLSTGQRRAISFCLAHALRDLEATTHGISMGFLAIDEISGNWNAELVDTMMEFERDYMIKNKTALTLITHDVALQQRADWDKIIQISRINFSEVRVIK